MDPRKKAFIDRILARSGTTPHINCNLCSSCGGRCCKDGACGLMPVDIPKLTVQGIIEQLRSGKYSITFFCLEIVEGVVEAIPMMTAREVRAGTVNNSLFHRPCSLLTPNGCALSEEDRPTQALLFIPRPNNMCRSLLNSEDVLSAWLPYQRILEEVVLLETQKSSNQLFKEGCLAAVTHFRKRLAEVNGNIDALTFTDSEIRALQVLEKTGDIDYII